MHKHKKFIVVSLILILLYVLLGNARSIKPNPFIPGAVIAVNMIVPVLAGKIGGKKMGALVGFFGTLLNALSPAGSAFEFAAVLPHTIMGLVAGMLKEYPNPITALSLIVGHLLNVVTFLGIGLVSFTLLANLYFWIGMGYETFIGIVGVIIIHFIYKLGFEKWH